MRYRLVVLMLLLLLAMLPIMNMLAAPAPERAYAILDIGPPPKDKTAEEHRKWVIAGLPHSFALLSELWLDPEVKKLPSLVRLEWKDARPWLEKNILIKEEGKERRLRLTFQAGGRAEQVTILNNILRQYLQGAREERIRFHEKILHGDEDCILELEKRIDSGLHPRMVDSYRKSINDLHTIHIPERRAEIERLKQTTVIKWAK